MNLWPTIFFFSLLCLFFSNLGGLKWNHLSPFQFFVGISYQGPNTEHSDIHYSWTHSFRLWKERWRYEEQQKRSKEGSERRNRITKRETWVFNLVLYVCMIAIFVGASSFSDFTVLLPFGFVFVSASLYDCEIWGTGLMSCTLSSNFVYLMFAICLVLEKSWEKEGK